ncbi:MAG: hypothetical protein M1830_004198 [Pleopsidium flavum]|nr:MAG: hypothetical protein M1830_004198 [Pleopsidium flavum]
MARFAQTFDYHRPSPSSLDIKHRYPEEDESSVLDENILDSYTPDMSPLTANRRDSFPDSNADFSPREDGWPEYTHQNVNAPVRVSTNSTNPFFEQSNNPFLRPQASQAAAYAHQSSTWNMDGPSGSCTPTAVYDGFPSEYESNGTGSYSTGAVGSVNATTYGGLPYPTSTAFGDDGSLSTSPASGKDWMSMNASDQVEPRSIPKRMRPGSPSYRSHSPLLRRDGIRKKNARFEIPAERNLQNIDQLIGLTSDEQEIKELKQQKRLLRNRQAALDSRQRKKQHTERLEEEKKHFTTIITELEEALAEMKLRESEWEGEKNEWASSQQQCKQYIDNLLLEKEEMVRSHTLETGDLRKKNAYLTEHVQHLESTAMSAVPSSSGFSADFSDFENLTMDSSPWDDFSLSNDFSIDNESHPATSITVLPKKTEKTAKKDDDRPAGLLLVLLLFGAFVASKSSTTTSPSIPHLPDDVRAASATVLDTIFKDAGVQPSRDSRLAFSNRIEALEPTPSSTAWPSAKTTLSAAEIAGLSRSPLDALHRQLVDPTKEQIGEQLFSLSAEQYNGVTSQDFINEQQSPPTSSQHRRNLGEALAAMRNNNNKDSAAEVYTRSLMWDKVPAEVVRDFARMVTECSSTGQHQDQSPDAS